MKLETDYIKYEDSAMGKLQRSLDSQHTERIDELQKLRDDFDKYRADYAANKASDEKRRKRERRGDRVFAIIAGAVSGIIGSAIGGLVVYYWPHVITFFSKLFH